MTKQCDHHYWAPMPNLRLCFKCGNSIKVYHPSSYSHKEFNKMYPNPNLHTKK